MSANILFLTPRDPRAAPEVTMLATALQAAGFAGGPLPEPGFYKPGAEFFSFINFLGCSPVVSLGEPGATAEICRIEIPPVADAPQFVAGRNLKPPRCPACGHRPADGRAIGEGWARDAAHRWNCPGCGRAHAAPELNWRHCAGFGRCFVKVWGVFEGEAVANETLLQLLAQASGENEWREFYITL